MGWLYKGTNDGGENRSSVFNWSVPDDALVPTVGLELDFRTEFGIPVFENAFNLYRVLVQSIITRAPQPPSVTRRDPPIFNSFYPAVQLFFTDEEDNVTGLIEQRFQSIICPYFGFCQAPPFIYGASINSFPNETIDETALGPPFALKLNVLATRGAQGTLSIETNVIAAIGRFSYGGNYNYTTKGGLGTY